MRGESETPTTKDRMVDKLIAIESWAYRLRHLITGETLVPPEKVRMACTEIQYRFDELKKLAEKEGT
jgi:hypothetical protein